MRKQIRGIEEYDLMLVSMLETLNTLVSTEWDDVDEMISNAASMSDSEIIVELEVSLIKSKDDIWVGKNKKNLTSVCKIIQENVNFYGSIMEEERLIVEHQLALEILA